MNKKVILSVQYHFSFMSSGLTKLNMFETILNTIHDIKLNTSVAIRTTLLQLTCFFMKFVILQISLHFDETDSENYLLR